MAVCVVVLCRVSWAPRHRLRAVVVAGGRWSGVVVSRWWVMVVLVAVHVVVVSRHITNGDVAPASCALITVRALCWGFVVVVLWSHRVGVVVPSLRGRAAASLFGSGRMMVVVGRKHFALLTTTN